jgi:hypothetical protein
MTKCGAFFEDCVGCGGPDEGPCPDLIIGDEVVDLADEVGDRDEGTA